VTGRHCSRKRMKQWKQNVHIHVFGLQTTLKNVKRNNIINNFIVGLMFYVYMSICLIVTVLEKSHDSETWIMFSMFLTCRIKR